MEKLISCEYNMDNALAELCYTGGSKIAIDTIGIENQFAENRFQRSELDWLISNKPLEYAQLVLSIGLKEYLFAVCEHSQFEN